MDQAGVWTVGYGATGGLIGPDTVWTPGQAESALILRLNACGDQVSKAMASRVTQDQFDAMTSLAYNIGVGAFRGSTLVRLLNGGDVVGAADEFLKWDKVGGVVNAGLLRRREAERELFLR
jgi:lysozyme